MTERRRRVAGWPRTSSDRPATAGTRAITGDVSALSANNRTPAPAEPAGPPVPSEPSANPQAGKQTNKAVTVYISPAVYTQARLAYKATSSAEGDRNWSQFVEKAIASEIDRRAQRHNGGDPFLGVDAPLSPGRPLAD